MNRLLICCGVWLMGEMLQAQLPGSRSSYEKGVECKTPHDSVYDEALLKYMIYLERNTEIDDLGLYNIKKILKDFLDYRKGSQQAQLERSGITKRYREMLAYKQKEEEKWRNAGYRSAFLDKLREALPAAYEEEEKTRESKGQKSEFLELTREVEKIKNKAYEDAKLEIEANAKKRVFLEAKRKMEKIEEAYFKSEVEKEASGRYKSKYLEIHLKIREGIRAKKK